jgi:hypothetical protein
MSSNLLDATQPIEVWLTKKNIEVTCRVVFEDESDSELDVDSLSMRGAQREITAWLIREGYDPAGRWEVTAADEDGTIEAVRHFRPHAELPRLAASKDAES